MVSLRRVTRGTESKHTLLSSTKTNDLAVQRIAHAVGLRVLERNSRNGEITQRRLGDRSRVLGHHDGVEGLGR